jgi:hypothetical protein
VFSAVNCIVVHCVVVASGEEPVAMACRAIDLASFSHASPLLLQLKTSHTIVAHCYGLAPFTAPAAVPSSSVVSVAQDRILSCVGGRLDMRGSTRKQGSTGTRSVAKSNSRTYLSLRNLFTESESTVKFLPPPPLFLHLVVRASDFRAACFHFLGLAASVVFACGTCLTPVLFLQQKQDQYAVGDFMTRREDLVVVEASTTVDEGTGTSLFNFLWSEAPPWNHVSLIAWRQCWLLTHVPCAYWSVSTALELLVSHRITGLPVVDDMGRLVWCLPFPSRGIFSSWPFACKQRASNFLASIHKRTNLCRSRINMFVQCCVRVLL